MEGVVINRAFWHGRRVFVTGHTGFKGSWLCLWLQSLGARVSGFALDPSTEPSLYQAAQVGAGMSCVQADVRNASAVLDAMRAAAPDVVFHLAAQPLVRASYADPLTTYATNVMGTVHVLDAARHVGSVRAFVNVTSDKCYENACNARPYVEQDRLGGDDPYSSSKACAELVTNAYRRSFFSSAASGAQADAPPARRIGIASARAGNVIGGGDWAADRLIPDLVRAFERGMPAALRHPHSVRPWQHVLEPLAGYLLLAEHLDAQPDVASGAWNFGPRPADMRPVADVAAALAAHWGNDASFAVQPEPGSPAEAGLLLLDSGKARRRLGWRTVLELDDALAWVVKWHSAARAGHAPRTTTLEQIAQYEARIHARAS
jgi:CDP-glucose 4,6-dehydratase